MSDATAKQVEELVGRGLEHYGCGELDQAITTWERALTLAPENREAREYLRYVRKNYSDLSKQFEGGASAFRFTLEGDSGFALDENAASESAVSFDPSAGASKSALQLDVDEGWLLGGDATTSGGDETTAETVRSAIYVNQELPDTAFDFGDLELEEPSVHRRPQSRGQLRSEEPSERVEAMDLSLSDNPFYQDPDNSDTESPTRRSVPVLLTDVKPATSAVNFNVIRLADRIDAAIDLVDPLEADGGVVVEMTADSDEEFSRTESDRADTREDVHRATTREDTGRVTTRDLGLSHERDPEPALELRTPRRPVVSSKKITQDLGERLDATIDEFGEPEGETFDATVSLLRKHDRLMTPAPSAGAMPMDAVARDLLLEVDQGAPEGEAEEEAIRRRVGRLLDRAFQAHASGHHSTAFVAADLALTEAPAAAVAQKILHSKERDLVALLRDYIGDPNSVPRMAISMADLMNSQVDSRSAFLVSRVDGVLTFDELVDVSGMQRLEAHRHLCRLLMQGILEVT